MKNLLIAILCSLLLHATVVVFFYLTESASGPNAWLGALEKKPGQLKVRLGRGSAVDGKPAFHETAAELRQEEKGNAPESPTMERATDLPHDQGVEETESRFSQGGSDYYYSTTQLTNKPAPLNEVALGAPETSYVVASGAIVLTLWINALGDVAEVAVDTADLPEEVASGVVTAFKQLRFKPGELNGQKVGAVMRIEVTMD